MEFGILGPLEARDGDRPLAIGRGRERALLALLLLHRNTPVAGDRLIDALWGEDPPPTVATLLHGYVSKLRKVLGHDAIATRPGGYLLLVEPGALDLDVFEERAREGRDALAAGDARRAAAMLGEALALWHGPPLADLAFEPFAQLEIARLEELRLGVLEARIDADLALGRHAELVGELEALVAGHPEREHLREQLMLALYRCGRQAEALAAYRARREALVDELGIEPGPALQQLERAILRQDAALDVAPAAGRPQEAPGSSAALPEHATSFVGRGEELAALHELVRDHGARLVTLTGPGGAGKTRLALEAARRLAPGVRDGAAFVDLSATSEPALVAGEIAGGLGLREVARGDAVDALLAHLRDARLLLVLDNFEQVLGASALVSQLLAAAPGLTVVVTSRVPLRIEGERLYPVPPLGLPARGSGLEVLTRAEAVALFLERARAARPEFAVSQANAEAVAELCVLLDGMPLALELAAARVVVLSPRSIVSRLGRWLDLLKSSAPELPERHRSLRATIEWSYDLLDPGERTLFATLGVFAGGFTADAAEAVGGDAGVDVLDGVEALLHANLLRAGRAGGEEPRFELLETIREYALERMEARDDVADLRRRHAGFFLALAEEAEHALRDARQTEFLERLDAEQDNLRAAIAWSADGGEPDTGLRTAASLWRYWQTRGQVTEGRETLDRLLARRAGSRAARAAAELSVARCALVQADFDTLDRAVAASLPVHRKLGDHYAVCFSLILLGTAASARGDHERARSHFDELLATVAGGSDPWLHAFSLELAGVAWARAGDLAAGRRALEEALRGLREAGDARSVSLTLHQLAAIAHAAGDLAVARSRFEDALSSARALGDQWGIVHSLDGLAAVALEQDDLDATRELLTESLVVARDTLERPGITVTLEALAELADVQGLPERAARLYGYASVLRETTRTRALEVRRRDHTGHIAHVRELLGEEGFADCWSQGRAMTLDETLAYALAGERPAWPEHVTGPLDLEPAAET